MVVTLHDLRMMMSSLMICPCNMPLRWWVWVYIVWVSIKPINTFPPWCSLSPKPRCLIPTTCEPKNELASSFCSFQEFSFWIKITFSPFRCTTTFSFEYALVLVIAWAPNCSRLYVKIFPFTTCFSVFTLHLCIVFKILLVRIFRSTNIWTSKRMETMPYKAIANYE